MFCTYCGEKVPDSTVICPICGHIIETTNSNYNYNDYLSEHLTLDDLKRFVGLEKLHFYLSKWEPYMDDEKSISPTWNWPAFLFTFFWLAFRKMYLFLFLYYIITFAILYISPVEIESLLSFCFYIFMGMYGNKLYFIHCKSKIKKIKASSSNQEEILSTIENKGGCSIVAPLALFSLSFILFIFL